MTCDMFSSSWKMAFELGGTYTVKQRLLCKNSFSALHIYIYMYTMQFETVKSFPIEDGLTMISAKISGVVLPLLDQSLPLLYMD